MPASHSDFLSYVVRKVRDLWRMLAPEAGGKQKLVSRMHPNAAAGRGKMGKSGSRDRTRSPAFQIIILGSSGGPREDRVTALLVRSTATNWRKCSLVAVDAGTLMAAITRMLESSSSVRKDGGDHAIEMTSGPFSGLSLPNVTAQANAAYVFRELISSVLITHPHLDHIAGLAMNTPAVEAQAGPQTVAALPSAIAALKNHVFNDIIWPNLSDEDGGAGLVTYQRLVDGGNPRLGRGEGRGYVKVCEGIQTKCLSVSHGSCKQRYNPETGRHHRTESAVFAPEQFTMTPRRPSTEGLDARSVQSHPISTTPTNATLASVESSAFFLRDEHSGAEIIVFGDIEPDSLSLEPRNSKVWDVAAPKIAAGILRAMFIECSFPDSVDDGSLYGHLCPRHLVAELESLASKVLDCQKPHGAAIGMRKRKREPMEPVSPKTRAKEFQPARRSKRDQDQANTHENPTVITTSEEGKTTSTIAPDPCPTPPNHENNNNNNCEDSESTTLGPLPLSGLRVFIIHVKDCLSDSPGPREQILEELRTQSAEAGLGCEFDAPLSGEWACV